MGRDGRRGVDGEASAHAAAARDKRRPSGLGRISRLCGQVAAAADMLLLSIEEVVRFTPPLVAASTVDDVLALTGGGGGRHRRHVGSRGGAGAGVLLLLLVHPVVKSGGQRDRVLHQSGLSAAGRDRSRV